MSRKFSFQRAVRQQTTLQILLTGAAGCGKSWTSLCVASGLVSTDNEIPLHEKIAVINTEGNRINAYSEYFDFLSYNMEPPYKISDFIDAITFVERELPNVEVLIIDSFSHAWEGEGGMLEEVDSLARQSRSGNQFTSGWNKVTPEYRKFIEKMLRARFHIIVTARAKVAYEIGEQNGKRVPIKIGLKAVAREGFDYEFHVVGTMTEDHTLIVTKDNTHSLKDTVYLTPNKELGIILGDWAKQGINPIAQVESELARLCKKYGVEKIYLTERIDKYLARNQKYYANKYSQIGFSDATYLLSDIPLLEKALDKESKETQKPTQTEKHDEDLQANSSLDPQSNSQGEKNG